LYIDIVPWNSPEDVQLVSLDVQTDEVDGGAVQGQQNGEQGHAEDVVAVDADSVVRVDFRVRFASEMKRNLKITFIIFYVHMQM